MAVYSLEWTLTQSGSATFLIVSSAVVSRVRYITTGVTEHNRTDSSAARCLLQRAVYQRCEASLCGPLAAGPGRRMRHTLPRQHST